MCGICGLIDRKGINQDNLLAMRDTMTHRGPDDAGIYISPDKSIGLGHRRLSIIDLSPNGHQPMPNEDGNIQLVFNGEFYTFKEYVPYLKERGHVFRSTSDSEVIIHLYEEFGLDFVNKLRGMFAFGLWDQTHKRLVLARDRVGIKPLYYSLKDDFLAFASEIKGLIRHPRIERTISLHALNNYFTLGYIPDPLSIYRDIFKLPPGHMLVWEKGVTTVSRYWELPETVISFQTEDELLEELREHVEEAVRIRLISDVPIGVFLSGGVDSSTVACIMAKYSSQPVKTFSIGFDNQKYNELPYAQKVADHIGADHHEFIVEPKAMDVVQALVQQFDEPFADASAIPTYYVSKMARQYVTVALGGDGGDELFGGYNWYSWVIQGSVLRRQLGPLAGPVSSMGKVWPWFLPGEHYLRRLNENPAGQFARRVSFFGLSDRIRLLSADVRMAIDVMEPEKTLISWFEGTGDLLSNMGRRDFNFYLPEDILTKVDRASMLVSLEARVPLLDHKLVEFAFGIPSEFKLHKGTKKYLLKHLAKTYLPDGYPLERKQGFSIPLSQWIRADLQPLFRTLWNNKDIWEYVDKEYVERIHAEHLTLKRDHGQKLWSLLWFGLWLSTVNAK